MDYCHFLHGLLGEGRVVLPLPGPLPEELLGEGDAILAEYQQVARNDLPEPMPTFDVVAARWGAVRMFRACQFAIYRDVDEGAIAEELAPEFPCEITPAVCYSVDLTFRFLSDLEKFARSASEKDPLVDCLRQWASDWPLSSVGMAEVEEVKLEGFIEHPGLRQLYVDRIITAADTSRLIDPRVRDQALSHLGMYPELAPPVAAACTQLSQNPLSPKTSSLKGP